MMPPAIACRGLAKRYPRPWWGGEVLALHPTDFEVQHGTCVVVLGGNGAGKSTLAQLIAGLLRPSEGAVYLDGRPSSEPAARVGLGFLPERPALPLAMSVREFVVACARLTGLSTADANARAGRRIEQLGLDAAADVALMRLSAGTRQRAGLAAALIGDPSTLILDEPLTGLDASSRRRVVQALRDARAAGATMLVNTHHLGEWSTLADRLAVMREGRLTDLGATSDVLRALPVRVQYVLKADHDVEYGVRLPSPDGLTARQFDVAERDPAIDAIVRAGGQLIRVEPQADSLLDGP